MSQEAHLRSSNQLELLGRPAGSGRVGKAEIKSSSWIGLLGSGAPPESRDLILNFYATCAARTTGNPWVRRRLAPASFRPFYLRTPARTSPLFSRVGLKVPRLESAVRVTQVNSGSFALIGP